MQDSAAKIACHTFSPCPRTRARHASEVMPSTYPPPFPDEVLGKLNMFTSEARVRKKGCKICSDRRSAPQSQVKEEVISPTKENRGAFNEPVDLEVESMHASGFDSEEDGVRLWQENQIRELYERYQPSKLSSVDRYLEKCEKVLMKLIWALEAKYEPEQLHSAIRTAVEVKQQKKEKRKDNLQKKVSKGPEASCYNKGETLWTQMTLPDRVKSKLARSEGEWKGPTSDSDAS
eukprot:1827129-Amphidinium_carterae.7